MFNYWFNNIKKHLFLLCFRETEEFTHNQVSIEAAFKQQSIVRGVYTAWNITQISYSLNKDTKMNIVFDNTNYWQGMKDRRVVTEQGILP